MIGRALAAAALATVALFAGAARAAMPAVVEGEPLPSLAPMLERVTPAVVNIATRGLVTLPQSPLLADPFFRHFFNLPDRPRTQQTQSMGSGVIIDAEQGLIVTNHHVIEGAHEIAVTLRDGRTLAARMIGTDRATDVAVLQVPAERLTAVTMADSASLRVGDFVVAIGNPFGLGQTVTSGIVSALGRSGLGIEGYEDFIQTDASINVGNSGGALVNLRGELIGINTAILAPGGGSVGIGFAIPSNMVRDVTSHLVVYGEIKRGLLGIGTQDLTPELAQAFGLPVRAGALIAEVAPESPAMRAGLRPGDVIVGANGKRVEDSDDARNAIGLLRANDEVELAIVRGPETLSVRARLADPEQTARESAALGEHFDGAALIDIAPGSPLAGRIEGVLVAEVERGSPAWRLGLRAGDVVTGVNRRQVKSLMQLAEAVSRNEQALMLNLRRGGGSIFILVQ